MSKTKTLIAGALAAAIVGTALAPVAMAAPQGRGGPQADAQVFANFDADKDGIVTLAEIKVGREIDFAAADTTKDGAVDLEEWKVFSAEQGKGKGFNPTPRGFERFDVNADGKVSEDEFYAPTNYLMDRFDADKDGKITSDEANARPMMGQRNAQNKRGPQDGSGYDNKQRGGKGQRSGPNGGQGGSQGKGQRGGRG